MKELLITKHAVAYAASKTSPTTIDTATSPEMLAEGSVGIYYLDAATKAFKLVIGTGTAATNIATAVSDTKLPLNKIPFVFALGTANGAEIKQGIKAEQVISALSREYADPVKQQWYVGYDGSTASKDFNLTAGNKTALMNYDLAGIEIKYRPLATVESDFSFYNASLSVGDTEWEIASKVSDAVNRQRSEYNKLVAEVSVPTYTGAVGVGVTGVTVTKGSNKITLVGAIGNILVNDYITFTMDPLTNTVVVGTAPTGLTGATYKVLAINTLVLTIDRNYSGESQTFTTTTGFVRTATAPTTVGVRLTTTTVGPTFDVSLTGVLGIGRDSTDANRNYSGADLTMVTGASVGAGTPALVSALEKDVFIAHGDYAPQDALMKRPNSRVVTPAVAGSNKYGGYDLYFIRYENAKSTFANSNESLLIFAFEEIATTGIESVTVGLLNLIFGVDQTGIALTTNTVKAKINASA